MKAIVERLGVLCAQVVADRELDVQDIAVRQLDRRLSIKVVIDCDGGVDADVSADVAHDLRGLIEADPAMGSLDFILEVSSPGVDRPLSTPREWKRNIGRLVDVHLDGATMTGRVVAVDDDGVDIDMGPPRAARVPFARIRRAVARIEFTRPGEGR